LRSATVEPCLGCGAETRTHRHHTSYDPEVTIALCPSCHSKVHAGKIHPEWKPAVSRAEALSRKDGAVVAVRLSPEEYRAWADWMDHRRQSRFSEAKRLRALLGILKVREKPIHVPLPPPPPPPENGSARRLQIRIRIEPGVHQAFYALCVKEKKPQEQVLGDYMRSAVSKGRL